MKNERAALSPAQESQLRAPTQRNRRASPHATAFCGCATPLSPPLRTAVRQRPGPRTPSASDAALRVHKARSPHQTRSGSRYGQAGCLLHQARLKIAAGAREPITGNCLCQAPSPPIATRLPLHTTVFQKRAWDHWCSAVVKRRLRDSWHQWILARFCKAVVCRGQRASIGGDGA